MGTSIGDTASTILSITLFVLGFVTTVLWEPSFAWLGDEAPYIFKMVGIGLIVFFLVAITFRLI
ncbi:hypothetical protein [Bradyrhizobium brasilense]|uniref:Uncharacterized protein n=1 Tax=Bradyrhizobium brasilense TaxID=1419277 RepID=A0A1G6P198_9BRAD|nr:hypothetical protein [Bradyrhizobium brasilense]MCC8974339.1 hypothetical protein [Bradyrhizobium brasilense]SDC73701.1 hypothetical protein SAMN05216337_1004326 [Bradyrhizobium brasilense]